MKKLITFFVTLITFLGTEAVHASDGLSYQQVGVVAEASSGLSVTVNSLTIVPKSASTQLVISYTQRNNTSDKKIDEGSFKLFFTDGSSEPQYGFFNSFFPGDGNTRSYTWEWLNGKEPWLIEWEAGFFTREPSSSGLKWKVGSSYPGAIQPADPVATPVPSVTPIPGSTPEGEVLSASFSGGSLTSNSVLKKKSTPYNITSPIRARPGVTLTIEAGVRIDAAGLRSQFDGLFGGAGNFELSGTSAERITISGPGLVWSPSESRNSRFIASHVKFTEIGALLPWEAEPFAGFELKNSDVEGRASSAFKSVVFSAKSFVLVDNSFEGIPGFELQGAANGNYEITGNTFRGNSKTNVPDWGMRGQWILTDLLTKFERNFFYDFTSPVIFKLWSANALDARQNFFNGLTASDAVKIRTLDTVKRSSGNNGDVILSNTLDAPPDTSNDGNTSEQGGTRIEYSWSGKRISIEVKGMAPSVESLKLTYKIASKWYVATINKSGGRFLHSQDAISLGTPMFFIDGVGVDGAQRPTVIAKADQRTLSSFGAQVTSLTPMQRSQIKAAVDANPTSNKFICTGIRFESAPLTENLVVRKRAKAACEYAKQLNPELSTWYQNKPTKARSFAGRVLLTIKN